MSQFPIADQDWIRAQELALRRRRRLRIIQVLFLTVAFVLLIKLIVGETIWNKILLGLGVILTFFLRHIDIYFHSRRAEKDRKNIQNQANP
jgi:hypothetical protein